MDKHNHNLNIHYSLPNEIWDKVAELYTQMPYWDTFVDAFPLWDNTDGNA